MMTYPANACLSLEVAPDPPLYVLTHVLIYVNLQVVLRAAAVFVGGVLVVRNLEEVFAS